MNLIEYVNEIFDIATANDKPIDVGMDMFINNIEDAERANDQYFYHGADEVDYKALKAEWNKLSAQEKANAKNEFMEFVRSNQK